MALKRMDNILIVVDDLMPARSFFLELGLEVEGETTVEGPTVDRLIALQNVRATLFMLTPTVTDGSNSTNSTHRNRSSLGPKRPVSTWRPPHYVRRRRD